MEGAEGARTIGVVDAAEEVGVATPGAVEEGGLIDDVRAAGHGGFGGAGRGAQPLAAVVDGAVGGDGEDRPPLVREGVQVARLVLEAAAVENVEDRVVEARALDQAVQGSALERGQVLAGEEGDEVGGGEDRGAVDALHGRVPGLVHPSWAARICARLL